MTSNILIPKTTNKFRVLFEDFGNKVDLSRLTQQVITITRPSISLNWADLMRIKPLWKPIVLVLRDEVTSHTLNLVMEQIKKQMKCDGNINFSLKIETLDRSDKVLETWKVSNCQIINCDNGILDYAKGDALTITLSIEYETAELT